MVFHIANSLSDFALRRGALRLVNDKQAQLAAVPLQQMPMRQIRFSVYPFRNSFVDESLCLSGIFLISASNIVLENWFLRLSAARIHAWHAVVISECCISLSQYKPFILFAVVHL